MDPVSELVSNGLLSEAKAAVLVGTGQEAINFGIASGLIDEHEFYLFLSRKYSIPLCNLNQIIVDHDKVDYDPSKKFFVVYLDDNEVSVALSDPGDLLVLDRIKRKYADRTLKLLLVPKSQIERLYESRNTGTDPIIDKTNEILRAAISKQATDIHFDPGEKLVDIKLRIFGELTDGGFILLHEWERIKRRLKILADLDVTETRLPQSGHGTIVMPSNMVNLRVSTHPGVFGESVTIRVQDFDNQFLSLSELKFDENVEREIRKRMLMPSGLFVIAGPTGSGKTTTLYAILNDLKHKNIMTLEDPVELKIPGIKQLDVKEENLISFADGIRSILRHDPDIILIGEIRDSESAKMALRAALTGKLVFTTVHAKDCVGAVERLVELGLTFKEVVKNTGFVMSQRLFMSPRLGNMIPLAEVLDFDELSDSVSDVYDLRNANVSRKNLIEIATEELRKGSISKESFVRVMGESGEPLQM